MTEHSKLLCQFRESDELAEELRMHCKKILAISRRPARNGRGYRPLKQKKSMEAATFTVTYEPRQANLCLRAFRHDKFQLRMPSHSEGPEIWFSV